MTGDIRVLTRERLLRDKDTYSIPKKQNRSCRREMERAARNAEKMQVTRVLNASVERAEEKQIASKAEKAQEGKKDSLVEAIGVPGFVRTRAGLLVSAVLAAELFAAGCGAVVASDDDEDVNDVEIENGADADSELDVDVGPDLDTDAVEEDVEATPDQIDELVDDVGPDLDTDAVEEDVEATPDEVETIEGGDVPDSEVGGCEEVPLPDDVVHETGPEPMCGNTQNVDTTTQVTEMRGSDCETPGIIRRMYSKIDTFSAGISTGGLSCARGVDIHALNGDMIIVSLEATRMEISRKIDENSSLGVGENLGGTAGEYRFTVHSVAPDRAVVEVYDLSDHLVSNITVYVTSYAVVPGFATRGLIAYRPNMMTMRVGLALIELPLTTLESGMPYPWTVGDGENFTFRTNLSGTDLMGIGWTRTSP